MKLWLDDIRPAPEGFVHVHSYDEFECWINTNGLPEFISFDHDLGEGKDGHDCAVFLTNYCWMNGHLSLPDYTVHSMNPVGKENIIGSLAGYEKFLRMHGYV